VSDRWGFEEADDWEVEDPQPEKAVEAVSGQDADGLVTVTVTPTAEVVSVRLAGAWRESRRLAPAVVSAVNAATARALAWQVENPPAPVPRVKAAVDETPITAADALRLVEAVSADLAAFTRRTARAAVQAHSGGGHVRGTAEGGQVVEMAIDPGWASAARVSEVESELLDALRDLRSTSPELAGGPTSEAITELAALLADPTAMLRRVGLR
jgi:DNA-binding protein YbaB